MTKASKAEPLGHVLIPLNDILLADSKLTPGSKSSVINSSGYVVSEKDPSRKIGMIWFKLWMRKTLSEALKWYKEKISLDAINSEKIVSNMQTTTTGAASATANLKNVVITVLDCKGLVSKLSKNPIPFFYYQFFNFDEHYSQTLNGANPIFNDEMTYEVKTNDPQFKDYLQTGLEIYVFDDNAPLIDAETKGEVTDMIGTANIDLNPLFKGDKIDKQFLIKDSKNWDCGSITV